MELILCQSQIITNNSVTICFSNQTSTQSNTSSTNITYSDQQQSLTESQYQELYIWSGLSLFFLYLSAFGNLLTLIVIIRAQWWKTGIQVLIASLTLCDLVSSAIVHPEFIINVLVGENFPYTNRIFCRIAGYVLMCVSYITPLHCCMIAINRLFAIVVSGKRAKQVTNRCAGCLMAAAAWLIPGVVYSISLAEIDGVFEIVRPFQVCSWAGWKASRAYSYLTGIINLYAPTLIIMLCYSAIYFRLRFLGRFANSVEIGVGGQHQLAEDVMNNRARNARKLARLWQVAKMMLVTFLVFLVCYIPVTSFFYLAKDFYKPPMPTLLAWLMTISYIGPFCNPIIYAAMNKDFHDAYVTILGRLWPGFGCRQLKSNNRVTSVDNDYTKNHLRNLEVSTARIHGTQF